MTIDEMHEMLDELADEIPEAFFEGLNGGISLVPDVFRDPHALHDDLFILGMYHRGGGMGSYITIYYGSFIEVYGNLPKERMKEKLRKTLRHEFRHHVEYRAGMKDLEDEDERQIANYLASHAARRKDGNC